MQIKVLNINTNQYLDFIKSNASVYNTPDWLALYKSNLEVFAVYEKEIIVAVFNTYTFKKTLLQFFIPPPFSPDCNLLISPHENKEKIISTIANWLVKNGEDKKYSLIRFNISYKYFEEFENLDLKGFSKKLNHTYVLDLSASEDVQSLYAPKRRQQIRRAIKDNVQIQQITNMQLVFDLVKKTFSRQGKSIDESFVKKILFEFSTNRNSFAFAATINNNYAVIYFCIHSNNEAFYLLGGYDETIKHIGAGPLAMSACIEYAKKIGITSYDFEGSMEPNIEKYFKEFGGNKKQYICYEKSSKFGEMAVKIKKLIKG